jgi:uncharacterized protein with PQ loop repeat
LLSIAGGGTDPTIETGCVFQQKEWIDYALGVFLIIGVLVSYIPQHIIIIKSGTAKGISWFAIFLANVSTASNTLNVTLERWDVFACCSMFPSVWQCNGTLLPLYQVAMGWLNCLPLYILVLIYFPKPSEEDKTLEENQRTKKFAQIGFLFYAIANLIIAPVLGFIFLFHFGSSSPILTDYAFAIGIVSAVAEFIHWTPQIWKTWKAKDPGSLSILMLLLQAPGSFLVVFFQIRYHENLSSWLTFFVTGVQQIILLILCLVFEIRKRRTKKATEEEYLIQQVD